MSHATYLSAVPTPAIEQALAHIQEDLVRVEAILEQETASSFLVLDQLSRHLLRAGGKRLRPAMIALTARSMGDDLPLHRIALCGAAMELIHMATLVHDDVIDETTARRGKPTANALWGNAASVLSGDALLAKAMRLFASDKDITLIQTITEMVVAMSEGAAQEAICRGKLDLSEDEYFEIIRKKTAVFIEGCCEVGAYLGGADEVSRKRMASYGYHVGMAFQVADDLLDYLGDSAKTGKTIGTDFKDGNATLPLIYALKNASAPERRAIEADFASGVSSQERLQMLAALIRDSGTETHCKNLALKHAQCALDVLDDLPSTWARECLETVAEFVIHREA